MNKRQAVSGQLHPNVFMLDAPGGTEQTSVTTIIFTFLKMNLMKDCCADISKLAAQLLPGGRAAHSIFKLRTPCDKASTGYITVDSDYVQQLKASYLIVWNALCMSYSHSIKSVDRGFQYFMNCPDIPFGGNTYCFSETFAKFYRSFLEVQDLGLLLPGSNLCHSFHTSR